MMNMIPFNNSCQFMVVTVPSSATNVNVLPQHNQIQLLPTTSIQNINPNIMTLSIPNNNNTFINTFTPLNINNNPITINTMNAMHPMSEQRTIYKLNESIARDSTLNVIANNSFNTTIRVNTANDLHCNHIDRMRHNNYKRKENESQSILSNVCLNNPPLPQPFRFSNGCGQKLSNPFQKSSDCKPIYNGSDQPIYPEKSIKQKQKQKQNKNKKPKQSSFQCSICHKYFTRKSNLKQHLKIHSNICDFTCPVCSRGFKQKHSMIDHIRTHTGERPFCCQFCPKAFKVKHNLTTHTRLHTGQRPYICSICNKRFVSKSSLNAHHRSKH